MVKALSCVPNMHIVYIYIRVCVCVCVCVCVYTHTYTWASQVALVVKNPPVKAEDLKDVVLICRSKVASTLLRLGWDLLVVSKVSYTPSVLEVHYTVGRERPLAEKYVALESINILTAGCQVNNLPSWFSSPAHHCPPPKALSITVNRSPCFHDIGISHWWALVSIVWVDWWWNLWLGALQICSVLSPQGLGNKQLEAAFLINAEHLARAKQMKKENGCIVVQLIEFSPLPWAFFSNPWKTHWK